jgi:hypothetical protein
MPPQPRFRCSRGARRCRRANGRCSSLECQQKDSRRHQRVTRRCSAAGDPSATGSRSTLRFVWPRRQVKEGGRHFPPRRSLTAVARDCTPPPTPPKGMDEGRRSSSGSTERARAYGKCSSYSPLAETSSDSWPGPAVGAQSSPVGATPVLGSGQPGLPLPSHSPLQLPKRERGLASPRANEPPEFRVCLDHDRVPILALDTDQHGCRLTVSRDDHTVPLGVVNACLHPLLEVSHRNRLHRMSSVLFPARLSRIART